MHRTVDGDGISSPCEIEVCRDFLYLPIEDARKAIGQKVNLFAIVIEIGAPRRSRGTDYVLSLKIVDQSSYKTPGLSINFFAEQSSNLPQVNSCGDLICLCDVTIDLYNRETYCQFKKKMSSFALFKGKIGEDMIPYQTCAIFHNFPHHQTFIRRLRGEYMFNQGLGMDTYNMLELRGIKTGVIFDLVCKVLYVFENNENELSFLVWDGTDAPPNNILRVMDEACMETSCCLLQRDVLRSFPSVGTILQVVVKSFFKETSQLQGGQFWVKFCNMGCEIDNDGIWKGVLQAKSKIRLLSERDKNVVLRESFCKERWLLGKESALFHRPLTSFPWPSTITVTEHEDEPDATLRTSLAKKNVTHKFKCIVRVVAAYPWKFKDLCCGSEQGYYRIKLTLEDPTARIHAYLYKEDGVNFFGGYPPGDDLRIKWNMLLGIHDEEGNTARDPPWISCCIKSFYSDAKNPWVTRKYRIFGTKLVK